MTRQRSIQSVQHNVQNEHGERGWLRPEVQRTKQQADQGRQQRQMIRADPAARQDVQQRAERDCAELLPGGYGRTFARRITIGFHSVGILRNFLIHDTEILLLCHSFILGWPGSNELAQPESPSYRSDNKKWTRENNKSTERRRGRFLQANDLT